MRTKPAFSARLQQRPPGIPSQPETPTHEPDPIRPQPPIPPGDPKDPPPRIPPGDPVPQTRAAVKPLSASLTSKKAKQRAVIAQLAARKPGTHGHSSKQDHGVPPQQRVIPKTPSQRLDEDLLRAEGEGMVPDPVPSKKPSDSSTRVRKDGTLKRTEDDRRRSHVAR